MTQLQRLKLVAEVRRLLARAGSLPVDAGAVEDVAEALDVELEAVERELCRQTGLPATEVTP